MSIRSQFGIRLVVKWTWRTLTAGTGWCVSEVVTLFASWRLLEMSPRQHSLFAWISLSKQKHRLQKADVFHFLFSDVLVSPFFLSYLFPLRIQIQLFLLISLLLSSPSSFLSPNSSPSPHRFPLLNFHAVPFIFMPIPPPDFLPSLHSFPSSASALIVCSSAGCRTSHPDAQMTPLASARGLLTHPLA